MVTLQQRPLPRALSGAAVLLTGAQLAELAKSARDLSDMSPVDAEHVYQQLLANFRPEGIAWVRRVPWAGPVSVPLDDIDWDHEDSWAASHQKKHVKRFAKRIRAGGEDINPVILVRVPGDVRDRVIDGHHRALAYRREGLPVKAYVGTVPSGNSADPWFQAHLYQVQQGGRAANKSVFAGSVKDATLVHVGVESYPAVSKNITAGALGTGAVSGLVPYDLVGQRDRDELDADDDGPWEPVSFAQKTAAGKIFVRLADLVKVGPEGYIHGFICVRPPCGPQYKEAIRQAHGGKTVNQATGQVIGKDLKKDAGDAGYSIRAHGYDDVKGVKLSGQYATRQDASKAAVLYHNISVMRNEAGDQNVKDNLSAAQQDMKNGDHYAASMHLAAARLRADNVGAKQLATHIDHLHSGINSAPKPVYPEQVVPGAPEPEPQLPTTEWEKELLPPEPKKTPASKLTLDQLWHKGLIAAEEYYQESGGQLPEGVALSDLNLPSVTPSAPAPGHDVPEVKQPPPPKVPPAPPEPVTPKHKPPVALLDQVASQLEDLKDAGPPWAKLQHHLDDAINAFHSGQYEQAADHLDRASDEASKAGLTTFAMSVSNAAADIENKIVSYKPLDQKLTDLQQHLQGYGAWDAAEEARSAADYFEDGDHQAAITALAAAHASLSDQPLKIREALQKEIKGVQSGIAAAQAAALPQPSKITPQDVAGLQPAVTAGGPAEAMTSSAAEAVTPDVSAPEEITSDLQYLAEQTHSSSADDHIHSAVAAIENGNWDSAVNHVSTAIDIEHAFGNHSTADELTGVHGKIQTAAIAAAQTAESELTSQEALTNALESIHENAHTALVSGTAQPKAVLRLQEAHDAVQSGLYDHAAEMLAEAHDFAAGNSGLQQQIKVAQAWLQQIAAAAATQAAAAPAALVPKPKKLSKAKAQAADDLLHSASVHISSALSAQDRILEAREALQNGDLHAALTHMQDAYDSAHDHEYSQTGVEKLVAAHAIVAAHLGEKPLQLRTITQAHELAEQVAAAAGPELDSALGYYIKPSSISSANVIENSLRSGGAASLIRTLRRVDTRLKSQLKFAYGSQETKIRATQKKLRDALKALEKQHDLDLKEQSFEDRADRIIADLGTGSSYLSKKLRSAVDNVKNGNVLAAQNDLTWVEKQVKTFNRSFAPDIKKLRDSLTERPAKAPGVPGAAAKPVSGEKPGELVPSRKGDVLMSGAEHYMATGEKGTTENIDISKASAYKIRVAYSIADEMSGISTQDLARVALGNHTTARLSHVLIQAIADHGTRVVRVNESVSRDSPKQRYTLGGDTDHMQDVRSALSAVNNFDTHFTSYSQAKLRKAAGSQAVAAGMSYGDREILHALGSGGQVAEVSPGDYIALAAGETVPPGTRVLPFSEQKSLAASILQQHLTHLINAAASGDNAELPAEDERSVRAALSSALVELWAQSSNDDHKAALAVQRAVQAEFGLHSALQWAKEAGELRSNVDEYYKENETALRAFVRAQYELTQRELKAAEIKSVVLHRAMSWDSSQVPRWAKTQPDDQHSGIVSSGSTVITKESDWRPISSWSHRASEANKFYGQYASGYHSMQVRASVPAELVFSTPRTGNGCLNEREWVVLASPGALTVGKSK